MSAAAGWKRMRDWKLGLFLQRHCFRTGQSIWYVWLYVYSFPDSLPRPTDVFKVLVVQEASWQSCSSYLCLCHCVYRRSIAGREEGRRMCRDHLRQQRKLPERARRRCRDRKASTKNSALSAKSKRHRGSPCPFYDSTGHRPSEWSGMCLVLKMLTCYRPRRKEATERDKGILLLSWLLPWKIVLKNLAEWTVLHFTGLDKKWC